MKEYIKKSGLTLIEMIISIAIIAVLFTTCLTIFTGSFKGVLGYGKRTKTLFECQNKIDTMINDLGSLSGDTAISLTSDSIRLKFNSQDLKSSVTSRVVWGKIIRVKGDEGISLSTFVPDN